MSENVTKPTDAPVAAHLAAIPSAARRKDAAALCELMEARTGVSPVMWGTDIVGFGSHHYTQGGTAGGEAETVGVGFAARKQALAVYGLPLEDLTSDLEQLGPHTTGKGCLYLPHLAEVDHGLLGEIIAAAYAARTSGA